VPDGTACGDPSNTQCDNPDSCLAGTCVPNFEPPTTVCDDGLYCTTVDTCDGMGACTGETSPCQFGETCDEDNDICVPPVECVVDDDCDQDFLFCNGDEICVDGQCQSSGNPCQEGEYCDEFDNVCLDEAPDCIYDADCDDGLYCNGVEFCDDGTCAQGDKPCPTCTVCDEDQDTCEEVNLDLDITKFAVNGKKVHNKKDSRGKSKGLGSVAVGKPIKRMKLTVINPNGNCETGSPATLIGVQDGKEIYNETRVVYDLGEGQADFTFPSYTPIKKGTIVWTVEIFDNDPDDDTATVSTRVR
jgi:hypothetical protein